MKYCGKKRIQKFLRLSIELFLKIFSIYKEKPPYCNREEKRLIAAFYTA